MPHARGVPECRGLPAAVDPVLQHEDLHFCCCSMSWGLRLQDQARLFVAFHVAFAASSGFCFAAAFQLQPMRLEMNPFALVQGALQAHQSYSSLRATAQWSTQQLLSCATALENKMINRITDKWQSLYMKMSMFNGDVCLSMAQMSMMRYYQEWHIFNLFLYQSQIHAHTIAIWQILSQCATARWFSTIVHEVLQQIGATYRFQLCTNSILT